MDSKIIHNFYQGVYLDDADLQALNKWAQKAIEALIGGGPYFRIVFHELCKIRNRTDDYISSRSKER